MTSMTPSPTTSKASEAVDHVKVQLRQAIESKRAELKLSQGKFSAIVGLTQPRYNLLARGKLEAFTTDSLLQVALKAGLKINTKLILPPRTK